MLRNMSRHNKLMSRDGVKYGAGSHAAVLEVCPSPQFTTNIASTAKLARVAELRDVTLECSLGDVGHKSIRKDSRTKTADRPEHSHHHTLLQDDGIVKETKNRECASKSAGVLDKDTLFLTSCREDQDNAHQRSCSPRVTPTLRDHNINNI
jgi:hypothetical protein